VTLASVFPVTDWTGDRMGTTTAVAMRSVIMSPAVDSFSVALVSLARIFSRTLVRPWDTACTSFLAFPDATRALALAVAFACAYCSFACSFACVYWLAVPSSRLEREL
jgi:hypothetical protein